MITENLNHLPVPLVNGAIVEFYGNGRNSDTALTIIDLPWYMLVRLQSKNDELFIYVPGLHVNVVPTWPESFRYNAGHGKWVSLCQFPVTLAFGITHFKCQGQIYESNGAALVMSPYVQRS